VSGRREFDQFYRAVFGSLVGQLVLVTGDRQEAEDIAQEALSRAAARWHRLRDYDIPEAWVRKVALNLAASRLRQVRTRLRVLTRGGLPPPAPVPAVSEDALALAEAMRALPVRQRQALVLHYLLGLTTEEAGAALGVPAGTVKSWLARGRKGLAAQLGEHQEVRSSHG
jgi:RNA polymerase sigma-70 factor (ECF subfamily)